MASQPSALASDSCVDINQRWLKLIFQHKIDALQAKTNTQMKKTDTQYKRHSDAKVRVKSEFVPSQWVFVDEPFLTGKANRADEMATVSFETYSR